MRLPVKPVLPIAALFLLTGCIFGGSNREAVTAPVVRAGPAADYPMVLGDPFTIEGITYTPADKLNYDDVGYAAIGVAGGGTVTGAHKTMPLPSYVEVTSLDSGRTALVRLERRGPMANDRLVELSPGAAAQLGLAGTERAPVRVRRVNPPEQERAMLRGGQPAAARMDTPKPLLAVLMRKLSPQAVPAVEPGPVASQQLPDVAPSPVVASAPRPDPVVSPVPWTAPATAGTLVVQAAAFSTRERANRVASALGGSVSETRGLWRVRIGPFAAQSQAEAALARARGAGYSDARIQRAD